MIDAKLKPLSLAVWFSVTGCALTVGAVQAAEFDTGNPDWTRAGTTPCVTTWAYGPRGATPRWPITPATTSPTPSLIGAMW